MRKTALVNRQQRPGGQSMLEYAVLVGAVTAAIVIMSDYVRRAFNAHARGLEKELNGAVTENRPN